MLLLFLIRHLVQHFRRHVLRRATNALGPLYGRPNVVLGQAEVPQLHVPFRAQQDLFSIRVCLECKIRPQAHQKQDVSREDARRDGSTSTTSTTAINGHSLRFPVSCRGK